MPPRPPSVERATALALSRLQVRLLAGELPVADVPAALRRLADDTARRCTQQPQQAPEAKAAVVHAAFVRLFDFWRAKTGHQNAQPTRDRERRVVARLREGYTEQQIQRGILGCARSDWHRGENPEGRRYDDLELICRSGSKLEKFIALADEGGGDAVDADVAALTEQADRALREGRLDDYHRANARLSGRTGAGQGADGTGT